MNFRIALFKVVLIMGVLGALGIACLVIFGDLASDEAAAGAVVALAGLGLAALASIPGKHLIALSERVTSVSVGKYLDVTLNPLFDTMAAENAGTTSDDPDDPADTSSLVELKRSLDTKLAYLAKHVLAAVPAPGVDNVPTFLNIGSLAHDKYLIDDEAEMAYEIIGMRPAEFSTLPLAKQRLFLDGAGKFVDTVRVTVFAEQVYQALRRLGYLVRRVNPHGSRQRDLTVRRDIDSVDVHHVIPVFTERRDSGLFTSPRERLLTAPKAAGQGKQFIVVPPLSNAATDDELLSSTTESGKEQVWIVTLSGLIRWLQTQNAG
jgi:hypothetical protein